MGFFNDIFLGWAVGRQRKDFLKLLEILRGLDDSEIAYVVQELEYEKTMVQVEAGIKLMSPFSALENHPNITAILYKRVVQQEKLHDPVQGAAATVWLYTIRAAARSELRVYGKEMWDELARGMKGAAWFPDGFTPNNATSYGHTPVEAVHRLRHEPEPKPKRQTINYVPMPAKQLNHDDIIATFTDEILHVFINNPEGVPLIKGGADALTDFAWEIFKLQKGELSDDELSAFIFPQVVDAQQKGNTIMGLCLRLFLIDAMRRPAVQQNKKQKIHELCELNKVTSILYIDEYTRTARMLGIVDTTKIDTMLKIRGVI